MSPLPNPLPITPFTRPARGEVTLPGSKSLTNRALLLGALCDGPITLAHALASEDTALMAAALNALGIAVRPDPRTETIRIAGQGGRLPVQSAELFVGNAGTAARFLTALCAAAAQGVFRLDGAPQMRRRPMRGLIEALRSLGADIRCRGKEGFLPLEIQARGLRGGAVAIDAGESSQMLSALLMIAPLCPAPLEVTLIGEVRWPFVQMTARLMEHFGQPPVERRGEGTFLVANTTRYRIETPAYAIEPDATAASYFSALPLVAGGRILLPGLRPPGRGLQGDAQFISVLGQIGLTATDLAGREGLEVFAGDNGARRGVTQDFRAFSDTFLTLAAIAPLLADPTRITGIAHTRRQETDRVAGVARQLRKLGQEVREEEDALTITPRPLPPDVEIETYGDHRFAMSFAILGCHDLRRDGRPWLRVRDPGCCAKTFPDFFEVLDQVWKQSHPQP
jgi:3-phosphoshikimate 1-carboxyvinyltransferase